jgi:hypothetical protein
MCSDPGQELIIQGRPERLSLRDGQHPRPVLLGD